jgi:hypothetical protein
MKSYSAYKREKEKRKRKKEKKAKEKERHTGEVDFAAGLGGGGTKADETGGEGAVALAGIDVALVVDDDVAGAVSELELDPVTGAKAVEEENTEGAGKEEEGAEKAEAVEKEEVEKEDEEEKEEKGEGVVDEVEEKAEAVGGTKGEIAVLVVAATFPRYCGCIRIQYQTIITKEMNKKRGVYGEEGERRKGYVFFHLLIWFRLVWLPVAEVAQQE